MVGGFILGCKYYHPCVEGVMQILHPPLRIRLYSFLQQQFGHMAGKRVAVWQAFTVLTRRKKMEEPLRRQKRCNTPTRRHDKQPPCKMCAGNLALYYGYDCQPCIEAECQGDLTADIPPQILHSENK